MQSDRASLTIIDLISEQHAVLRKATEDVWAKTEDVHFSHTDFYLISKIAQKDLSISQAAEMIKISRQAMHKAAAKLKERGFIEYRHLPGNQRDKHMYLTEAGTECARKYERIKINLENRIKTAVGEKSFSLLKEILGRNLV
ncbi:MarR family transcriptional regulator [Treponema zuelzerae]|uniref:MarR family transcriptional regulator n=1 Tax=Teretinema zuelzerae TaxID=156 RepID=A0AAE3EHG9_9SPIR|nr:MarR family transcriptional regulator [Teretinema zuelzerae]MCD1654517.1 MarR family transcriptional regulator [Teretinema zuelzerae]